MMLIAAELPKDQGMVVFLPATIGGCISDISNKDQTVVYTDTFPEGVTVAMPVSDFVEAWHTSLFFSVFYIEFTPASVPELHH